jgi:hypothetical protein
MLRQVQRVWLFCALLVLLSQITLPITAESLKIIVIHANAVLAFILTAFVEYHAKNAVR